MVVVRDIEFRGGTEQIQGHLVEPISPGRMPGFMLVQRQAPSAPVSRSRWSCRLF
jgi:hypothetical protein